MKRLFLTMMAVSALLYNSCNKDEDITVDSPGGEDSLSGMPDFTVVEYLPAPGQFINEPASGFHSVTTMEDACAYAEKRLGANSYVSLGAWGGYITVKAKKSIPADPEYSFTIAGNAFDASSEPGIVWVMQDTDGNGLPDDQWYELKGSWFGKEGYERNYSVTYYRPEASGQEVKWTDSDGHSGTVAWNGTFHGQDFYYPAWVGEESYTLRGSRLPDMARQDPENGNWELPPSKWGYADNDGEDSRMVEIDGRKLQMNYFRISDAVDSQGNPVNLNSIDFIKVQTAVTGNNGVIGEVSTEVCGFFRIGK